MQGMAQAGVKLTSGITVDDELELCGDPVITVAAVELLDGGLSEVVLMLCSCCWSMTFCSFIFWVSSCSILCCSLRLVELVTADRVVSIVAAMFSLARMDKFIWKELTGLKSKKKKN